MVEVTIIAKCDRLAKCSQWLFVRDRMLTYTGYIRAALQNLGHIREKDRHK